MWSKKKKKFEYLSKFIITSVSVLFDEVSSYPLARILWWLEIFFMSNRDFSLERKARPLFGV